MNRELHLLRPSYRTKLNAALYAQMMACLLDGASVADVVEEVGLGKETVRKYLNALWNHGVIHILRWDAAHNGRRVVAVYRIGKAKDAAKPVMSGTERTARYRAKKKREQQRALQKAWSTQARRHADRPQVSEPAPCHA